MPTYTEFDSSLSLAMLDEALKNQQIKFVLTEIATRLRNEVLPVLVAQEQAGLSPKLGTLPYVDETDAVERKLPYAVVGNYSNFLHPMYADRVIQRTKTQLDEGLDLRFDNEVNAGSLHK